MSNKKNRRCKDCKKMSSAGRTNPPADLVKYNSWCCFYGKPTTKAIGECTLKGGFVPKEAA